MTKKCLLAVFLMAIVAGGAFASPEFRLSAGGGGFVSTGKDNLLIIADKPSLTEYNSQVYKLSTPSFAGGGFIFFDVSYAELSLGLSGGSGHIFRDISFVNGLTSTGSTKEGDFSLTQFNISFLGKYPFWLTEKFALFPLLGIDYLAMLSMKDEDGNNADNAGDFSALWIKLGIGMDCLLAEQIYLRFEVLGGSMFHSKSENDFLNTPGYSTAGFSPSKQLGATIKLAAGYRF